MKKIKYIFSVVFVLGLLFSACSENDPKIDDFPSDKVAFKYEVNDGGENEYRLDFFIGSTIAFTNTSTEVGAYSWDFGDGLGTSKEQSPSYVYEEPGMYDVTLVIEGVGKRTQRITISELIPRVKFNSEDSIPVIKSSAITLTALVPNPRNAEITYKWIFPEGTTDESGAVVSTSSLEDPGKLKFNNVGSQSIILQTIVGDRVLEDVVVNAQIGYNQKVKTLYYAVKGGNMMALKLINNLSSDVKNKPFNLGTKSGQHPFNIIFNDTSLYVLDAGMQYSYILNPEGFGDGRITVLSKDGKEAEVMLSNAMGKAYDDPFFGHIIGSTLYYSDRNMGIVPISLTSRNMAGILTPASYFASNSNFSYGGSLIYGAMNANMLKYNGVWWWCKSSISTGIFRFKDSDIGITNAPADGIILGGEPVKSLVIGPNDLGVPYVYVAVIDKGLYSIELSKLTTTTKLGEFTQIAALPSDTEGPASERIYISQLTLDPEDGSVYFGYRAGPGSTHTSGLKRYNPKTKKLESLVDNVEIYGVTINGTKSLLF